MKTNLIRRIWFGPKYDGVIEAVRYTPGGTIKQVRAYQRRGPTFSDHVLLDRDTLLQQLTDGKRYYTGQRLKYLGSEFELGRQVMLVDKNANSTIVTEGINQVDVDKLEGVPLF